ncbi:M15 family metallopeptidase [uncultured Jatrophihabitans sp.]|uniref:M15 family metallopeptidase n=1 Tax=uncultured Jatrophihabitans sp. TaxID=1610747 RepID=UPI0035CC5341
MTLLIGDPAVANIPVCDSGEPLVVLERGLSIGGREGICVRSGIAARLGQARALLPPGYGLAVVDGFRPASRQQAIIDAYTDELRRGDASLPGAMLDRLVSRHVAPLATAPHVAGAAVDLTLTLDGEPVWMGSELDATPEQSDGRCFTDAPGLDDVVRGRRKVLAIALVGAGLVNYPTEWWHWSHGDRYWAAVTGAPHAVYGPVVPEYASGPMSA